MDKLRSVFGTARRIVKRNYYKPLELDLASAVLHSNDVGLTRTSAPTDIW
jgi:hypothetical protein